MLDASVSHAEFNLVCWFLFVLSEVGR